MNEIFENNNNNEKNEDSFNNDTISYQTSNQPPNANDNNVNNNNPPFQNNTQFPDMNNNNSGGNNNPNNSKTKNKKLILSVAIISVVALSVIGLLVYPMISDKNNLNGNNNTGTGANILQLVSSPTTPDTIDQDGRLSTTAIASKVRPSVVGIVSYTRGIGFEPVGQGSGVIMTKDGYIITNAHVLLDSNSNIVDGIKVVLDNNEEFEAKIVGIDRKTDLAVIKVDANNLTAAEFGDSDKIKVGETVIAIGNPSGLELAGSVTQGIVSAIDRNIQNGYATTFIQTDAAINPGNSGGALVNMYGQIIGINSSKIAATNFEGIGFAIPTSKAKPIIDDLVSKGYVSNRVKLGVSFKPIDEILSKLNDVPLGLRIVEIEKDSSLFEKGARPGDIITDADGKKITSSDELIDILKTKKPGDNLNVALFRLSTTGKSSTLTINITLAEDKGDFDILQSRRSD